MLNNISLASTHGIGYVNGGKMEYITTNENWTSSGLYGINPKTNGTLEYGVNIPLISNITPAGGAIGISNNHNQLVICQVNPNNNTISYRVSTLSESGDLLKALYHYGSGAVGNKQIKQVCVSNNGNTVISSLYENNGITYTGIIAGDAVPVITPIALAVGQMTHGLVYSDSSEVAYSLSPLGDSLYQINLDGLTSYPLPSPPTIYSEKFSLEVKTIKTSSSTSKEFVVVYTADEFGDFTIHFHSEGLTHQALGNTGIPIGDVLGVHLSDIDAKLYVFVGNEVLVYQKDVSNRYLLMFNKPITTNLPNLNRPFTDLMVNNTSTEFIYPENPSVLLVRQTDNSFVNKTVDVINEPTEGGLRALTKYNYVCHDKSNRVYQLCVPTGHYGTRGNRSFLSVARVSAKQINLISDNSVSATVVNWTDIQNRPYSSVAVIDDMVAKRHSHANLAYLNKISEDSGTGQLLYNGRGVVVRATNDW